MKYWVVLVFVVAAALWAATAAAQTPAPTATATASPSATPSVTPPPSVTATPPSATPTASPTATATGTAATPGPAIVPIPAPPVTLDFTLDNALRALSGTSVNEVLRSTFFLRIPCNVAQGIPCPPGQPTGTYVDGMWVYGCQASFIPAGTQGVIDAVQAFLAARQSLWAVTRTENNANGALFELFYLPNVVALHDGHGIFAFQYPCGPADINQMILSVVGPNPEYVIAPPGAPLAPATGSGMAAATRDKMPLVAIGMSAIGAAVLLFGVAVTLRRRV